MKKRSEIVRSSIEQAIFIFVVWLFAFLSVAMGEWKVNVDTAMLADIHEGWIDEDGQAVDLYDLARGNHSVTLDISGLNTDGKAICFKTIDTNFKVYASDGMIYDYDPVIPKLLGISYGMQYHTVPIPEGSAFVRLDLEPVFSDTPVGIRDITIGDAGQFLTSVFKRNLFSFQQGVITVVIGILFVIAGVTGQIVMKFTGIDFISFGITCIMVGYIGFNDTLLLQILTGRPDIIRVSEYMCLALISFPMLSFPVLPENHIQSCCPECSRCVLSIFFLRLY